MTKAEINSTLDIAYDQLTGLADVVKKELKEIVVKVDKALHTAIEASDAFTPVEHTDTPKMTEGTEVQKEIALRKMKDIGTRIEACAQSCGTEDAELKANLAKVMEPINEFVEKAEEERKAIAAAKEAAEVAAKELAEKEAAEKEEKTKQEAAEKEAADKAAADKEAADKEAESHKTDAIPEKKTTDNPVTE
jgi:chromosome segregation ATPase